MTPAELQKENAALREQLASAVAKGNEAIDLAVETSVKYGEATSLVSALTGAVVAQKDAAPPAPAPAPQPPPAPAAPPPPRPASTLALRDLPAHERAAVRAAYPNIDAELDEQFHARNRIGGASRGGFSGGLLTIPEKLGGPHVLTAEERAAADVAAYGVGAPKPRVFGSFDPVAANLAARNAGLGWGAPKPATKAAAPAPSPVVAARKALGGGSVRKS